MPSLMALWKIDLCQISSSLNIGVTSTTSGVLNLSVLHVTLVTLQGRGSNFGSGRVQRQ